MFLALLCYLSVRSAAPELRRGQHGAGLPRGEVQSWRPRRDQHGAGLPRGEVQSWRLRRGQHGAGLSRERSRAGGYGAVSRAGTRQTQELAGDQPEKMAGARRTQELVVTLLTRCGGAVVVSVWCCILPAVDGALRIANHRG